MLEVDPERLLVLFEWGKRLADTAERQPELFNKPGEQLRAAEAELPEQLAAVLAVATPHQPNRNDLKRRAQHRIVRIAEDVAMSRVGSGFYVKDMCDAAGVSERTLEYAFRDVMGLSPVAFLIRLRLHRARQALLAADPESATVTAIALHWGFGHLGEFAHAYKDCFGELPSETLAQQPTEIPNSI
jgi:AraC-like DNA-binding protein